MNSVSRLENKLHPIILDELTQSFIQELSLEMPFPLNIVCSNLWLFKVSRVILGSFVQERHPLVSCWRNCCVLHTNFARILDLYVLRFPYRQNMLCILNKLFTMQYCKIQLNTKHIESFEWLSYTNALKSCTSVVFLTRKLLTWKQKGDDFAKHF